MPVPIQVYDLYNRIVLNLLRVRWTIFSSYFPQPGSWWPSQNATDWQAFRNQIITDFFSLRCSASSRSRNTQKSMLIFPLTQIEFITSQLSVISSSTPLKKSIVWHFPVVHPLSVPHRLYSRNTVLHPSIAFLRSNRSNSVRIKFH